MIRTDVSIGLYNWLIEKWDHTGALTSDLKTEILKSLKMDKYGEDELRAVLAQLDLTRVVCTMMPPRDILEFCVTVGLDVHNDDDSARLRQELLKALTGSSKPGFAYHLQEAKRHVDDVLRQLVLRRGCLEPAAMRDAQEAIVYGIATCASHFESFIDCVCEFAAQLVRNVDGDDGPRRIVTELWKDPARRTLGSKLKFIGRCCARVKPSLPDTRLSPFVSTLKTLRDTRTVGKERCDSEEREEGEAEARYGTSEEEVAATTSRQARLPSYFRQMTDFRNALHGHPGGVNERGNLPEGFEDCDADVRSASECLSAILGTFSCSTDEMLVPGIGHCVRYTRNRWGVDELLFDIEKGHGRMIATYVGWDPNVNAFATLDDCVFSGEDLFIFPLPTASINRVYKPLIYRRRPAFE